ncbi:MAG: ATP-dependent Clp protease ATP-binding subunit ClpB [Flavobacteriales bacterium]
MIAELGYDPQFGARPLKRVLQRELINELSKEVLSGDFGAGDTIYVSSDGKKLLFSKEPHPEAKAKKAVADNGKAKAKVDKPKAAKKEEKKDKQLEDLKKATKDVEDAVKDIKKEK